MIIIVIILLVTVSRALVEVGVVTPQGSLAEGGDLAQPRHPQQSVLAGSVGAEDGVVVLQQVGQFDIPAQSGVTQELHPLVQPHLVEGCDAVLHLWMVRSHPKPDQAIRHRQLLVKVNLQEANQILSSRSA